MPGKGEWKNVWVERGEGSCYNGVYEILKGGYIDMQVILSNRRCAVVQLERGARCTPQELARRLFPAGTEVEFEQYDGGVRLLFFWRRSFGGLRFSCFDDLADYLTACGGGGELWEAEGRLCLLGACGTVAGEYGARLTAAECARVREWGRSLGRAEDLRAALTGETPDLRRNCLDSAGGFAV